MINAGLGSRRTVDDLVFNGYIKLNGVITYKPFVGIDTAKDIVSYRGNELNIVVSKEYFMLNKPVGYITTANDDRGRNTVYELVPDRHGLHSVGRLDYNTSGLLLFTNDGELTYSFTHPKYHVGKVYIARLAKLPTNKQIRAFKQGLIIDDYVTSKANFTIISTAPITARIEIYEGRNRQVRKMCKAIDCPLTSLHRISIGPLSLGKLREGTYRRLTPEEINILKNM